MKFLSQPYLLSLFPSTEMNIVWIQSEKSEGWVDFGSSELLGHRIYADCFEISGLYRPDKNGEYAPTPEENEPVTVYQYIAKISNLKPGETIFYNCNNEEYSTDVYYFHTAPEVGTDFTFAQISDLQSLDGCSETVYKIGCQHPDFILYSGDATYWSWRLDQWFDMGENMQDEESRKRAFFHCMQQRDGARLLQYAPMFFCPGNHELNDIRCYMDKEFYQNEENWNWSIFMQMFRPLYPDFDTSSTGKRWYSANYADLHIVLIFCYLSFPFTQKSNAVCLQCRLSIIRVSVYCKVIFV